MHEEVEDEEEDGIEPTHTHIGALTNFGIQTSEIKKLKEAGISTAEGVLRITRRKLEQIKGISTAKAEKLREAAANVAKKPSFQTAKDAIVDRAAHVVYVSTGCAELDAIFGGGIESGSITEFYGEYRTGKTQLCLTVCVSCFLPRALGGGEGRALFLDTEGTFRPERLEPVASRYQLDADFVLENVMHARVHNCDHLEELLRDAAGLFADADDQGGPFRVLIIDSIIALYRQEFIGRGELAERQQRIGKVLAEVKNLAEIFNLAVIITNQVTADPGASAAFVQDAKKAVGGHIVAHISDTRVFLRKGKGEQRIARIEQHPMQPPAEACFQVGLGGVTEPTE